MRGELPAEEEHELWTWFKQPGAREFIVSTGHRQSWTGAERNFQLEFKNRMFRNIQTGYVRSREEGKAKISSKVTVSPVVAICRNCCISFAFRLVTFVHLYLNLADKTENYSSQTYKILVDKGQRASVILPDGTKVWLVLIGD